MTTIREKLWKVRLNGNGPYYALADNADRALRLAKCEAGMEYDDPKAVELVLLGTAAVDHFTVRDGAKRLAEDGP